MARWWHKLTGEMSKLRDRAYGLLGGTFHKGYKLDSSQVNYELARKLYYNTDDRYKLGGGFAKPVVNTIVGFMGVPTFVSQEEKAEQILTEFRTTNKSKMQKTQLNSLRDGDCYVWITRESDRNKTLYPELKTRLVYNIIPPEQVQDIILDPITNEPIEYVLRSEHEWIDSSGNTKQGTVTQRIGPKYRNVEVDGDTPPGIDAGDQPTPWDFIPIVHFKNYPEETSKFGRSEIEAIEPFIKAYHDVMHHAMQGSKMHSTPRLKLKLKDVAGFLLNNFGISDPKEFAKKGGEINLDGHEMVILSESDEAEFIEARSSTGDAKALLKLLFFCIVDTSETPEFVFGVHTPASQASVKEQMPVLIRNIEKKRDSFEKNWQHLARIVLAMTSTSENISFATYETSLNWEKIDPRSGEEVANEVKATVEALVLGINNNLVSHEAAVKYLSKFIETMNDYVSDDKEVEGEKDRIIRSRLERERLSDTEYLNKQLDHINKMLDEHKKAV